MDEACGDEGGHDGQGAEDSRRGEADPTSKNRDNQGYIQKEIQSEAVRKMLVYLRTRLFIEVVVCC